MTTSRLEINLAAIDHNVAAIRAVLARPNPGQSTPVQICGIVKQDAYGLGALRIARRLSSLNVELLAVYCVVEARQLAEAHIATPILILMPVDGFERSDPLYRVAVTGRLHLVLHSERQAQLLISAATRLGVTFPVHIQVDTGMSRGGCLPDEAERLVKLATTHPRLRLAGLMTHFSSPGSDEPFTREQARQFRAWIERVKPLLAAAVARGQQPCVVHAANTAATFRAGSFHATMVRVGQGLLGYGEEAFTNPADAEFARELTSLKPALRWMSRIVHVQEIPAGWPVGYGRTWTSTRPSRIAIVPVGYADGFPVALSNQAKVRLTGQAWDRSRTREPMASHEPAPTASSWVPVVGRVSMDQITLDITDAPADLAQVGMEVEVIGATPGMPNHLPVLAEQAHSITHELMCRLSPALERQYLFTHEGEAKPVVVARPLSLHLHEPAA
ncbi:alanine racemase [soil metagenome]